MHFSDDDLGYLTRCTNSEMHKLNNYSKSLIRLAKKKQTIRFS